MNGNIENGTLSEEYINSAMEDTGYKVFNDSVHGHITLHPLLVKVVDTPEFQRLRNIKQTGLASYVYPGSCHSRFEHSLGTCYLAGQMMDKLMSRTNQRARKQQEVTKLSLCVQLAALCHDLGHGPFSHTWEAVTDLWGYSWQHEESSCQMFDYLLVKNNLFEDFQSYGLGKRERDLVKQIIMGGSLGEDKLLEPKDNFLYEIVSNKETGIDVDKWDYFLRDGLHLNLRITFDYRRLLEFCRVSEGRGPDGRTHLAFRDKEIMNLYDVYRVRSALHHTAYKHKAVMAIELMVIDAFKAAGDVNYKINNSSTALKEAHKEPETLYELTDHLFQDILYSRNKDLRESQALLLRVLHRRLYKLVGKPHIQLPTKDRKGHIQRMKNRLVDNLNRISNNEFRVIEFYLGLDSENDPISRVTFYQKAGEKNGIKEIQFEEIRSLLEPFPFQLTKEATAQFLVFYTSEELPSSKIEEAKKIINDFSEQSQSH